MNLENQGHVRYPLHNASKNETLKKWRKEGKYHGNPPPPPLLKVQCIKKEEGRKVVAKKFCPSLQDDHMGSGTSSQ
jgi:hypothetical protein